MTIGDRLKEERERLRLTQTAFGALAGVKKNTQILWEKGSSSPNATALSMLSEAGVDILYVVTGRRFGGTGNTAFTAEAAMDEIEQTTAHGGMQDKLRDFAWDLSLPERTRARADHMLARVGDAEAQERIEARDQRREVAFENARRVVREARFVVDWEPTERIEAELIRLVVDYYVDGREIEQLMRAIRDSIK